MPSLLAPPIPAKKLRGTLITKAQGQLITRKVSALYTHTSKSGARFKKNILTSGGIRASASAL